MVILLCEHNDEGSFGFVLNNYIEVGLDKIIDDMPPFDTKVSIGGPVKNSNLYYIHTLGEALEDSVEIVEGIYMGGNFEVLKDKLKNGHIRKEEVRFFVGYSGWSPMQLESEMKTKSWYVTSLSPDLIMNTEIRDLWRKVIRMMGKPFEHLANLPEDPSLN
jgi:putative transcriptional regulator